MPFGTVPIYQVIEGREVEEIDRKIISETIEKQAKQGVDFFTIHAGVLKEHLPLLENRVAGIASRVVTEVFLFGESRLARRRGQAKDIGLLSNNGRRRLQADAGQQQRMRRI